jgi:HAD superfamily hydrolase (TIGR01450 family)
MSKIKVAAFDLDGTLYLGDTLLPGAVELLQYLQKRDIQIKYFTNNSRRNRQEITAKLNSLGIQCSLNDVYTSGLAAAIYAKKKKLKKVWVLGSTSLKAEIEDAGLELIEGGSQTQAIIIGLDLDFDLELLTEIMQVWRQTHCQLIACNVDRSYPVEDNRILPGTGPIISAIENALNRKCDYVAGKPNTLLLELLAADCYRPSQILVIGDSLESDIAMAKNFHSPAILLTKRRIKGRGFSVAKSLPQVKEVINEKY